jgi:DNA (cytosine-5)-methyltransferase 1
VTAYYNEFDQKAAAWLRELIKAGHIAPGVVDERSIEDVVPDELVGYTQCHFFAGIGVWSYALRRAGWPDDRAIWTASCPCQPFSQAGEGAGFADERHLWPHLFHLIGQRRPGVVIGEQVASKDANPWLDLVQTDLEAVAYAFGAVAFPSAGIGAPHIRDRTYWLANANDTRSQGRGGVLERAVECAARSCGMAGGVAHMPGSGRREEYANAGGGAFGDRAQGLSAGSVHGGGAGGLAYADADWLFCRDGKWRPVEPGTFPLAHGAAARVGRLRGYGNAINAEAAKAFIEAVMETTA